LYDVWLRPRRVFRELADRKVGTVDHVLAAAQGIAGWLALCRTQNAGLSSSVAEIFGKAVLVGSVLGIASLYLMGTIYSRLGARGGKPLTRNPTFHVLAYGGVPLATSLIAWVFTALLAGESTFVEVPRGDLETFTVVLLRMQSLAYVALAFWSVLIQVMGLSEVQAISIRKAFGLWLLGQLIGFLALLFLAILATTLLPNSMPS
jgi:hypothetical protein